MDAEDARGAGPAGLAPLYKGLESTDSGLQAMAVRALGRFENPDRIPDIADLLSSESVGVRAEAANALGQAVFNSPGDSVGRILRERVGRETDPRVLGVLARTIGRLDYDRAASIDEAETTLLALTFNGSEPAPLPTLTGAVMGLEGLTRRNRGKPLGEETLQRLRALATRSPYADGESSQEELARIRRAALMALAATGGLTEESIRRTLEDTDPDVRRLTLASLARSSLATEFAANLKAALADPVPRVRAQAVTAFASTAADQERCQALLAAAQDPNPQVAITALDLLSRPCPNPERQITTLEGFLNEDSTVTSGSWHRGAHALLALASISTELASPFVAELASHENPFARAYAAQAATRIRDEERLEALSRDPDPNVRTAAVQGLFRLQNHRSDDLLLSQLAMDDPQLLLTVSELLEGTPHPEAATLPLIETFHRISEGARETVRDPRMGILERLGEVAGPETTKALDSYLSDYDPIVAEKVAELLTDWTGDTVRANPMPLPRQPLPSPGDLAELERSRVILEMEGGGEIEIRLFPYLAPTNAFRFANLARSGTLDGLTFHRVVSNFVLQGGSPNANEMAGHGAFTRDEIGLQPNWRGTVGTSTRGRDTGDGQIFINLVDNLRLDHNYTVFGEVVGGMAVVDRVVQGQIILHARVDVS